MLYAFSLCHITSQTVLMQLKIRRTIIIKIKGKILYVEKMEIIILENTWLFDVAICFELISTMLRV